MTQEDLRRLYDANLVDESGDKIGGVGQIYLDDQSDRPTWATVKTGLFGTKETFVPLQDASLDGDDIRVPYSKSFVKDAPNLDADHHITEQEEDELYRYYNVGGSGRSSDPDHGADGGADRGAGVGSDHGADGGADRGAGVGSDHGADGGADRGAGFAGDRDHDRGADRGAEGDSVVRREEELRVGTERERTGRVRLRKHVRTEEQSVTVPVEREEVHVEREPVREGENVGRIGDDTEEVAMDVHEERVVVDKQTVAKERVGLSKETVRDEERVTDTVRKEEVEVDEDVDRHHDGDRHRDGDVRRD